MPILPPSDQPPAGIPSGHVENRISKKRRPPVEEKTANVAQRALSSTHPLPYQSKHATGNTEASFRLAPAGLPSRHDETRISRRRFIPPPIRENQELRTGRKSAKTIELERLQEEFNALPILDFTVQPITKKEVIDITHSKAKLRHPESSRDKISKRLFFCSDFSDNDSFSFSREGGCLEMRGICNFVPNTTSVNQTDYALELEAYITSQHLHLLDYARGPVGHNPGRHPMNFAFGRPDFVQMTLNLVEKEPSFAENEVVCQCTYPAFIIRSEDADKTLLEYDPVTNEYERLPSNDPDRFKMEQYQLIKKECEKTEAQILGKMIVSQRIVHRHGELILEKGINGCLVECGRVNARELLKILP